MQCLPHDATTGPKARASAPTERNMPNTVPFCWTVPNEDATAVRNVGTVAAAINNILTPNLGFCFNQAMQCILTHL